MSTAFKESVVYVPDTYLLVSFSPSRPLNLWPVSFVFFWPKHFPDTPLLYPPNFDARIVSYPTAEVGKKTR